MIFHFRYRDSLKVRILLMMVIIASNLVACAPTVEEVTTQRAAPTAEPTEISPSATLTVAQPTTVEEVTPDPTRESATDAAESGPTSELPGQIPITNDIELVVMDQYGGVPLALDVVDDRAYVGFGPRLVVVDVSDPDQPSFLGESEPLPGLIRDIDVSGDIAYLAASGAGLVAMDVSDPSSIVVISDGPNYAGPSSPAAEKVTVIGNQAFLIDFNHQELLTYIMRFDVSDPAGIKLIDWLELMANDSVVVNDELIAIAGNGRMQLHPSSDPNTLLSETPLKSGSYASRIVLVDNIATVLESGGPNGIERFDISDPAAPLRLGELTELDFFLIDQTVSDGSYLYTSGTFGEFGHCASQIIAIDLTGEQPQSLYSEDPKNCVTDLILQGQHLYVTGRSGLKIFDSSDPSRLNLIGEFSHPDGFQDAQAIAQKMDVTYLLTAEGDSFDLSILKLDDEEPIVLADRQVVSNSTLLDLFVMGDTLIIPQWMDGLYTLDIKDPASPQLLHEPVEGEYTSADIFTVVLGEDVLYVPVVGEEYIGGIGAIDLSDPANPNLAAIVETKVPQVMSMVGDGQNLFALTQGMTNQIQSIDIRQPLGPALIGELTLPEPASRLALVDQTLYAACDQWNCQSLFVIDVSDPADPRLVQQRPIPFGVMDMSVDESGIIIVTTIGDGLCVLDARDPADLRLSGPFQLAADFIRIEIDENRLLVAAIDAGLYLIKIQP